MALSGEYDLERLRSALTPFTPMRWTLDRANNYGSVTISAHSYQQEEEPASMERPIEVSYRIDQTNEDRQFTIKVTGVNAEGAVYGNPIFVGYLSFDNACLLRDELSRVLTGIENVMTAIRQVEESKQQDTRRVRGWEDL